MEKWTVTKLFEFPAAHTLLGHKGHCRHRHGHSFNAEVCLSAQFLNPLGLVFDFIDMKVIKNWIEANWDHAYLVNKNDERLIKFLSDEESKMYIFQENPSSENIAKELYKVTRDLINDPRIKVEYVKVWEADKQNATYEMKG